MTERDYSHRRTVEKLGIKPGHAVVIDAGPLSLNHELVDDIESRAGAPLGAPGSIFDVALAGIDGFSDPVAILVALKRQMRPDGAIWLLTAKRGHDGYVNQDRELIPAGAAAGLVDNKICSVSDSISAMRFVLRKEERAGHCPVDRSG